MISLNKIEIVPTKDEHLESIWEILREWPEIMPDAKLRDDMMLFFGWFKETAKDSITALDNGEVIGCAYLDNIYPGYYATMSIIKRRKHPKPHRIIKAAREQVLPYFIEHNDLEKLVALIDVGNEPSFKLVRRLGFKMTGILRHHAKINSEWIDFVWTEILREEVFKGGR